jgi:hypothetical protein
MTALLDNRAVQSYWSRLTFHRTDDGGSTHLWDVGVLQLGYRRFSQKAIIFISILPSPLFPHTSTTEAFTWIQAIQVVRNTNEQGIEVLGNVNEQDISRYVFALDMKIIRMQKFAGYKSYA